MSAIRLEDIHSPAVLRTLSYEELTDLAAQLRQEIVDTVSERGGHLASNLGVVELTLALHRVFDIPGDQLIFDVGHQSYTHKLLTGRYWRFGTLRTFGGISGFPKRSESEFDVFETGHASTAISAAVGMARARDLRGEKGHVIALVGDGALTGGMCYEALNDAGSSGTRLIVILNDNEMSISTNVGALSRHLTDLRVSRGWTSAKKRVKTRLEQVPFIGKPLYRFIHLVKNFVKSWFVDEEFFSALGFQYFGPIDGHDLRSMEKTLRLARELDRPAVIHVLTQKGRGYVPAEQEPDRFHGVAPFYVESGRARQQSTEPGFGQIMAETLSGLAEKDSRVVAITAAMADGTGLKAFAQRYPTRTFDVGIAEEHAVTMAAGLAAAGMKPYFAVYATFFQRGFDQMIHDVCLQHLPVTFLLDRAGLVGEDGATHHGVFDLASMLPIPGLTVLAPRDVHELRSMLAWSVDFDGPLAIRYGKKPVDLSAQWPYRSFRPGRWEVLESGVDCAILAVGSMVAIAGETRRILLEKGIRAALVNCSTVKPMDVGLLQGLSDRPLFTMEEHVLTGGFGSAVTSLCAEEGLPVPRICFGIPDTFVQHGARQQLMRYLGLAPELMARRITAVLGAGAEAGK